ncbi:hypothetical protein [Homoserinibacter sp. YIM 151385]|uniref:hypothetical protein n=1 Tax=Homoserinibacter sp. YIM 151385 TaxID=2985506 RepID=UPI0022F0E49F|nr:hypothetical protein [Homoserinibacter sp. YIM 151385]WBU39118.1 hypothetical protein OF852_05960 [Homoserinibacter sp. YIM 151385]
MLQIVTQTGPVGAALSGWRRISLENLVFREAVDLADSISQAAVTFKNCKFVSPEVSLDLARGTARNLRFLSCQFVGTARLDALVLTSDLLFEDCFFGSELVLNGAQVAGRVHLSECHIWRDLAMDGIHVVGPIALDGVYASTILARHLFAEAPLSVRRSVFGWGHAVRDSSNTTPVGMLFDLARVESTLFLGPGLQVSGAAVISGLRCNGSVLIDGLSCSHGLRGQRAKVDGAISIQNSHVAAGLELAASQCERIEVRDTDIGAEPGAGMRALTGDGLEIATDLRLGPGLRAAGEVRLLGSSVGGQLHLVGHVGESAYVNAESVSVADATFLDVIDPKSQYHFARADLGTVTVDFANLPQICLTRATYVAITNDAGDVLPAALAMRLLASNFGSFSTSPYRYMAAQMRAHGDPAGARVLAIGGEDALRARASRLRRYLGWIPKYVSGYGYDPVRALWTLIGLVIASSIVFGALYNGEVFWMPVWSVDSNEQFGSTTDRGLFNPVAFAFAALLPGSEWLTSWQPVSVLAEVVTLAVRLAGWIVATILIAGITTRLVRSDIDGRAP